MLVEFRFKNFRSFRDEQVLSLVASKDTELPGNVITPKGVKGFRLLKSAAVYGPNGGGKSNLIRAAEFVQEFIKGSAQEGKPGEPIKVEPFAFSKTSRNEPATFELSFLIEGIRYQYGFTVDRQAVREEWLLAYPRRSPQRWFHRSLVGKQTRWHFSSHLKGDKRRLGDFTRPNALFLSVAAKFNHRQLTPIYSWASMLGILDVGDFSSYGMWLGGLTAQLCRQNRNVLAGVEGFLGAADTGIEGLSISREEKELAADPPSAYPEGTPPVAVQRLKEMRALKVTTTHESSDRGGSSSLPLAEESAGTQKLFALLGPWILALRGGYTLFLDEIHASMHPHLTRSLLEFFHDPTVNQKGAQLVFTTHDTTLLDPKLLRRDQIWFAEKDKAGASHLYSLQEYRPRKDEALQKGYLAGRYGAIPCFGEFKF